MKERGSGFFTQVVFLVHSEPMFHLSSMYFCALCTVTGEMLIDWTVCTETPKLQKTWNLNEM